MDLNVDVDFRTNVTINYRKIVFSSNVSNYVFLFTLQHVFFITGYAKEQLRVLVNDIEKCIMRESFPVLSVNKWICELQACFAASLKSQRQQVVLASFRIVKNTIRYPDDYDADYDYDVYHSYLLMVMPDLLTTLVSMCRDEAMLRNFQTLTSDIIYITSFLCRIIHMYNSISTIMVEVGWTNLLVRALQVRLDVDEEDNAAALVYDVIRAINYLLCGDKYGSPKQSCISALVAAGAEAALEVAMAKHSANKDVMKISIKCLLMLRRDPTGRGLLHMAAIEGNVEEATLLLDAGFFIETPDVVRRELLHINICAYSLSLNSYNMVPAREYRTSFSSEK